MKIIIFNRHFDWGEIWKLRKQIILSLINVRKILNLIINFSSYLLGLVKPKGLPVVLAMELSSECNLSCPICPRTLKESKPKPGSMSFENFKKIIDEVGDDILFLCLWNYGEPLLNKDIYKMIDYAKRKSIIIVMTSNFLPISETGIAQLAGSGLDYLIVSMDAATKATYEKNRVGGDFQRLLGNIRMLIEERSQRKKTTPFIDLQFIIMKNNEDEIEKMVSLANSLNVDKISFKKLYNINQKLDAFLPQNKKYILNAKRGRKKLKNCARAWMSSVILHNGDVVPCCCDFYNKFIFGNAFSQGGFRNVWKGKKYTEFRRKIIEGRFLPGICENCPVNRSFDARAFL